MLRAPFVLERHFARHEFTAKSLLSSSDCDAIALDDVIARFDDDVRQRWHALSLGYTDSRGLLALREQIAIDYDRVDAQDVLEVVPQEGVLLALSALVDPGDRVIVTSPAYQSLVEVVRFRGGDVTPWLPRIRGREIWFDLEDLELLLSRGPSPSLVVVNFPHNPTGAMLTPAAWTRLIEAVAASGARLFSDEMYRNLELPPCERLPSAVDLDERAVVLGGLSKSLSAPGLRTGWLVCRDRALVEQVASMKDWTTICAPGPAEVLALAVLRRRREIEARNRVIVQVNVAAVEAQMASDNRFTFFPPKAGSVSLLRLEQESSADEFCGRVLQRSSAMLVPASMFANADGGAFARFVRLGLGRASLAHDLPKAFASCT